jgi:hypothetical protein
MNPRKEESSAVFKGFENFMTHTPGARIRLILRSTAVRGGVGRDQFMSDSGIDE